MSESVSLKRASGVTLRGIAGLVPWTLLFAYIVSNCTIIGGQTDWGQVASISGVALLPVVLLAGLVVAQPAVRSRWRGWPRVLISWVVATCALFAAAWALGPFI